MAYKKPQDPSTNNGFGIYPLTTADQVILSDGSRLEKNGAINLVTLPTTEETPGEAPTINAGTFGGMTVSQFVEMIYPVGSIYMSANATSPETLFGGTWAQINGRFLIGTGTPENNDDGASPGNYNYAAGSTGGEATHTLTISEMPKHRHNGVKVAQSYLTAWAAENAGSSQGFELSSLHKTGLGDDLNKFFGEFSGGDAAHNNMPPYLAVYMWKRVS